MYPNELEQWVKNRIDLQYGKNNVTISHWWYYIDTYFIIAKKNTDIYCLKISERTFEESNILYISN